MNFEVRSPILFNQAIIDAYFKRYFDKHAAKGDKEGPKELPKLMRRMTTVEGLFPDPIMPDSTRFQELALENVLSLRNALLLYKILRFNEKVSEVAICLEGFDTFRTKYPFLCKFRGCYPFPKNLIATTYPCEILTGGKLYLGS